MCFPHQPLQARKGPEGPAFPEIPMAEVSVSSTVLPWGS